MISETYSLLVNGNSYQVVDGHPSESLLWVLRERLELSGSKNACEEGECGSCTVLVDGEIVCSCLVLAASAVGREITTIEGLGSEDEISDVQKAFVDAGAVQCGFCTPGLLVAIDQLLNTDPDPDDLTVREAISGNLCRCTGYGRILEAVRIASKNRKAQNQEEQGK
ncbi:MAG: (2Fe-2S)-binding protein [Actinobacteria bacterium]|jgi:carbon-monoxide dehydrogenase small subunit|nr:(2Fe-2S)-binding protein [Actinomycetota bacterium]MCH2408121.1 (2Fe-2S)-binding protein [Acidimicrobiales bacterium]|tara:strand:- start:5635 stop:6135 length:501 start_codon:yes stop_codon:yes gene_type:complete